MSTSGCVLLAGDVANYFFVTQHLVSMHALLIQLIGDALDSDPHFCDLTVIEGLSIASERLLCGSILKEHQDALYAAGWYDEIDIPEGVAFVFAAFSVSQYQVIQNRKAAFVLVVDHAGKLRLSDDLILKTKVFNVV